MGALPPSLRFEPRGAVGILRLSRPHKRNALDDGTIQGIEDFFSTTPSDIKAIVIHGEGEHFCAGLDLSELSERDIADLTAYFASQQGLAVKY